MVKGFEKYSNQWVAMDSKKTKVIVGGKNFQKVYEQANKKSKKPVFMRVPRLDAAFVGRCER